MRAKARLRVGQDTFLDALRSEIAAGTEILSAWVAHVEARGGIDILFEFEAWLRGLCAFLDSRYLPLGEAEKSALIRRSFAPEIRVARLALQECERCALRLCSLGQDAKVEFEALVESQIYKTSVLDSHAGRMIEQSTPMDSLTRLLESINDLKVMMDAVKDPLDRDFQFFLTIGRTLQRDIRSCRFIDMLLSQRFRLQYDRVDNALLSGILRSIPEEHRRRNVALVLLHLYRFLRYLRLVASAQAEDRPLRRFLVVFSLLRERTDSLCDFLRSRFLRERRANPELRSAAELIVHSLRMESRRVSEHELPLVASETDASILYAKIENSQGLLRNCYQSCIVTLAQAFDKSVDCRALFPSTLENHQNGQQLQRDLWDLRQDLISEMGKATVELDQVLDRIALFRESSLRYLVYQDWGEFERLSDSLIMAGSQTESRLLVRKFVGFLEILMQEVSKRSVLGIPETRNSATGLESPAIAPK